MEKGIVRKGFVGSCLNKRSFTVFYCISIITIPFFLYAVLFLLQDSYSLIPLSKWTEYLFKDSVFDFSDWLGLYFAVLIGLVGVYFTIVSILLNRKDITPFTCLKYTFFCEDYLLLAASVVNTVLALFCFPYIRFTNAVLLYFIWGIIILFLFFVKCTYSLVYTDREEKAAGLVLRRISLIVKSKSKKTFSSKATFNFVYYFIFKCFANKKFTVMETAYNTIEKTKKNNLDIERCFNTIISELDVKELTENEPKILKDYISFITKRLYNLIYKSEKQFDESFVLISSYYKKLFEIYKAYIYDDKVENSYLLTISEPITYIYKFKIPLDNKDKLMQIFMSLLNECKNLIYISLYHCNFETVRDEIHHYMNFVQFLTLSNEYDNLLEAHDRYLVDICTRIANVVQLGIVSNKYLLLIEPMLKQVKGIEISPVEYEMYDELLPEIGMHEVKYSKTYYIALIWLWYYCTKKELDFVFNKFEYSDGRNNEKVWAYKAINSSLEKIDYSDIVSLLPVISEDDFKEKITVLKATLFYEEKNENVKFVNNLKNKNYQTELDKEIETKKKEFIDEFNFMKSKAKKAEDITVEGLTFSFSVAILTGHSGYSMFGFSYYSNLKDFLFAYYLRSAQIIDISSLTGIKGLREKNELMLSRTYNKYFFEKREFDYFGGDLKIDDKVFNLEFINTVSNLIVLREDFNDAFKLDKIEVFKDQKIEDEKINIRDIFIEIPFKPIFKLTKGKHVAYKLSQN